MICKLIAGTALWLALCGGAGAADFTFAAFGDTPYTRDEEARFPGLISEINREDLAFVVHIGDFKSAWTYCTDELYLQRREWFDAFRHPFVFVPGDNEWTDCRRMAGGRYDPLERLGKLRALFFSGDEGLGQRRMKLERQLPDYPEHARWRHGGALFVTLNVPGPDNNARLMPGEFRRRGAAINEWLGRSFGLAHANGLRAVVILMQANPWASPANRYYGFRELHAVLARQAREFAGEVLLVHGDTHRYHIDQPMRDPDSGALLANFTRVEVFGYPTMNWVRIRVSEEAGRITFAVSPGS
jgi:hypothetical protein